MASRDEDETIIDIRFGHDLLDPSIHAESHAADLPRGDPWLPGHLDIGSVNDESSKTLSFGIAAFVFGVVFITLTTSLVWVASPQKPRTVTVSR